MIVEGLGGCPPAQSLAGSAVESGGDGSEVIAGVSAEVGALGEVLPQQAVDASMSSGRLVLGDVVLPGSSVLGHGAVDDVDQMAFEDAPGSAGLLGWLVAGQERSRARMESLLDDGYRVRMAGPSRAGARYAPAAGRRMTSSRQSTTDPLSRETVAARPRASMPTFTRRASRGAASCRADPPSRIRTRGALLAATGFELLRRQLATVEKHHDSFAALGAGARPVDAEQSARLADRQQSHVAPRHHGRRRKDLRQAVDRRAGGPAERCRSHRARVVRPGAAWAC